MATKKKTAKVKKTTLAKQDYIAVKKNELSVSTVYDAEWLEVKSGKYIIRGQYRRHLLRGRSYNYNSRGKASFAESEYYIIPKDY